MYKHVWKHMSKWLMHVSLASSSSGENDADNKWAHSRLRQICEIPNFTAINFWPRSTCLQLKTTTLVPFFVLSTENAMLQRELTTQVLTELHLSSWPRPPFWMKDVFYTQILQNAYVTCTAKANSSHLPWKETCTASTRVHLFSDKKKMLSGTFQPLVLKMYHTHSYFPCIHINFRISMVFKIFCIKKSFNFFAVDISTQSYLNTNLNTNAAATAICKKLKFSTL